jgi:NitT/TauT family transport system substrate-binding protein
MTQPIPIRVIAPAEWLTFAPHLLVRLLDYDRAEGIIVEQLLQRPNTDLGESLLSGEADFALGGLWKAMQLESGEHPYAAFAQINRRPSFHLFVRRSRESATPIWDGSNQMVILLSTPAPSPWFIVQQLLSTWGVALPMVRVVPGLSAPEAARLFEQGYGDVLEIADLQGVPFLSSAERYQPLSVDVGTLPWTVYFAGRHQLGAKRDLAMRLTRALSRAQAWLGAASPEVVAKALQPHFESEPRDSLATLARDYERRGLWAENPRVEVDGFERWSNMLSRAGWLQSPSPYQSVIDASIEKEAFA